MRLVEVVQAAFTDPKSDASNVTPAYMQCISFIQELRWKVSQDTTLNQIDKREQNEMLTDAEKQVTALEARSLSDAVKNPGLREQFLSMLNAQEQEQARLTFERQQDQYLALSKIPSKPDPDDINNY